MKFIDLTGKKFGRLTVIKRATKPGEPIKFLCICECGKECLVPGRNLRDGITKSCGCLQKEAARKIGMSTKNDLSGQKFGELTVLKDSGKRAKTNIIWECRCSCGNIHYAAGADLVCGKIKSCGCKTKEFQSAAHKNLNMIGKKFGKLTVLSEAGQNSDKSYNYLCQCDCGNKKVINGVSLRQGTTTSCGCINYSIGEYNIDKLLRDNGILFKSQYSIVNGYRFDFALLNDNQEPTRFIEFDGRQHYEKTTQLWENACPFEERQKRDKIKNEYALSHNIPLVRIPYWERDKITLDMLLGDKYLIKS